MSKEYKRCSFFIFAVTIVSALLLVAPPVYSWGHNSKAHNFSDIVSPERHETKDYHPIEIVVEFHQGARPETFQAWLNKKNITDLFEPVENRMKAVVGPEDGLRYRILDESCSNKKFGPKHLKKNWKGLNVLRTKIKGPKRKKDIDIRPFSVAYYPVQTERDDRGIWHITGGSLGDVFEAQGYAVASDRLWQMELYRRQALGRLSEIFGAGFAGTDVFMRTYGYSAEEFQAYFEAMDKEAKIIVQSYTDGINRRMEEVLADDSLRPFEFKALGVVPELWTATEVLAWTITLTRNFDSEGTATWQIKNAALLQGLNDMFGAEALGMFEDLRWINDPDALTVIPEDEPGLMSMSGPQAFSMNMARSVRTRAIPGANPDIGKAAADMEDSRNGVIEQLKGINAYVKLGSYAWVVSGDKTQSGNPIIYSGVQAGFSVPAIVQDGSIQGGGLKVSGGSAPGIPGILIGRTPQKSWTVQVGHGHTVDHYLEDPSDVFLHRTETIKVKGGDDIQLPVYRTIHGPVVYPMPYNPQNPGDTIVSWKSAAWGMFEFGYHKSILGLARSTNMDEFGQAIEDFTISAHFTYADNEGNIAYWMAGRDPIRPEGVDTRLPQLGDGSQEWPEPVTLKPRSTDRNTSQGFYSGWNNKTNPDYDNIPTGTRYAYGPFHRSQVIYDYLSTHDDLTFDDIRGLALDIGATDSTVGSGGDPWKFVQDDFSAAVMANSTPERMAALGLMSEYDGHFIAGGQSEWARASTRADSWVLMNEWINEVLALTFNDELAFAPQDKALLFQVLLHGLAGFDSGVVNNYDWFQNLSDPTAPQTAAAIIVQALDNVLAVLGPQPWDRDRDTINFNHTFLGTIHSIPFSSRATYAHCIEMGEDGPIRIDNMFPLGESGTILMDENGVPQFDEHFFSMTDVYDDFSYMSFPLFD